MRNTGQKRIIVMPDVDGRIFLFDKETGKLWEIVDDVQKIQLRDVVRKGGKVPRSFTPYLKNARLITNKIDTDLVNYSPKDLYVNDFYDNSILLAQLGEDNYVPFVKLVNAQEFAVVDFPPYRSLIIDRVRSNILFDDVSKYVVPKGTTKLKLSQAPEEFLAIYNLKVLGSGRVGILNPSNVVNPGQLKLHFDISEFVWETQ